MKVRYKRWCGFIAVLIYVTYLYTSGLASYIFGTWKNIIAALLGAVLLGVVANTRFPKMNKIKKIHIVDILVMIMICGVLIGNVDIKNGKYIEAVASVSIFLFYLTSKNDNQWMKIATDLIFYGGMIHAIGSFVFYMLPNAYIRYIMPIFAPYGYETTLLYCAQNGYAVGFSPHYSINAMYMSVALGASYIRIFDERYKDKKMWNRINILSTLFILFVLILTGKRAHCVFALVTLFLVYYVYNSDKRKSRLIKIITFIVIAIIGLTLIIEIAPDAIPVVRRFVDMSKSDDMSLGRMARIVLAWNLFSKNVFTGIGWNGFVYYYNTYFGEWLNVHNVYMQLLCEKGIIISLVFFMFFILSFVHAVKALKQTRKLKLERIDESLLMFSVYIQAFFLLYSLTGNPLYDMPVLFPYIFGCAFGEYYYRIMIKEIKGV